MRDWIREWSFSGSADYVVAFLLVASIVAMIFV